MPTISRACAAGTSFHQIIVERMDMPHILYDAYRLGADGRLQSATWSNGRRLISVAPERRLDEAAATTFRDLVEAARTPPFWKRSVPAQPAPMIEFGRLVAGSTNSAATAEPDAATSSLVASLQAGTASGQPRPGAYVWTKPLSKARPVDIDLRKPEGCDSPVGQVLAGVLDQGNLIAPLTGGADRYLTGDLVNRNEFGARFDGGYLGFGVIAA